jgi:hypothetical protein
MPEVKERLTQLKYINGIGEPVKDITVSPGVNQKAIFEVTRQFANDYVVTSDNTFKAIVYFKPGQITETSPSKKYTDVIQEGYKDWGIQSRK